MTLRPRRTGTAAAATIALTLLLSACATPSPSSPRAVFAHRSSVALDHYTAGSGYGGDGRDLLLFADGRWELWGSSCLDTHLNAFGHYQKTNRTLTLLEKGEPARTLYFHSDGPDHYLLTAEQLRQGLPKMPALNQTLTPAENKAITTRLGLLRKRNPTA